jgi:hypothetical protein
MRFATIFPTFVERLIRAVGWSPIGKSVRLLIDEGQDPGLIGARLSGTVTSLNADGSATVINSAGESFLVAPRHVGYGFYYLKVGKISAYLIADSRVGDRRIAQGVLSLVS